MKKLIGIKHQNLLFIVSTKTGERKASPVNYPWPSRSGKYVIGTDSYVESLTDNLLAYNSSNGQIM